MPSLITLRLIPNIPKRVQQRGNFQQLLEADTIFSSLLAQEQEEEEDAKDGRKVSSFSETSSIRKCSLTEDAPSSRKVSFFYDTQSIRKASTLSEAPSIRKISSLLDAQSIRKVSLLSDTPTIRKISLLSNTHSIRKVSLLSDIHSDILDMGEQPMAELKTTPQTMDDKMNTPEATKEARSYGSVAVRVYTNYIVAGTSWSTATFMVVVTVVCQALFSGSDVWLSHWTAQEEAKVMEVTLINYDKHKTD